MRPLTFRFRPTVPLERRNTIISQINGWQEISRTGRVYPDAKTPSDELCYYAYVPTEEDLAEVMKRLGSIAEIEHPSIPPRRGLTA